MKGPRSIAESVNSSHYGRFSTIASTSALSLDASYAGLKQDNLSTRHQESINPRFTYSHPSARDMVEKYERMCTPPPAGGSFDTIQVLATSHNKQDLSPRKCSELEAMEKRGKNRSPLRQSIRNLLSAIKKGATKSGEVMGAARSVYCSQGTDSDSKCPPEVPEKDGLSMSLVQVATTVDRHNRVDFSGPIWHFSRTSTSPPAWNLCTGIIKDRRLCVKSCMNNNFTQQVLEVDLSRCIDVRPVLNGELDEDALVSLSAGEGTRELKVLELFPQNRESQKFAVRNLGERAAWISALWDSIMPSDRNSVRGSQEALIRRSTRGEQGGSLDTNASAAQAARSGVAPVQAIAVVRQRERSLPPIPPQTPRMLPPLIIPPVPLTSKVDIMPRIDSARTPSPSIYSLGSPAQAGKGTTSPSITNLGRRSMVKQRLAEMQKLNDGDPMGSPCPKRNNSIISPCSPADTSGTGRSGFLSALMSEDGPECGPTSVDEHTPFKHLRESRFIQGIESVGRPGYERSDSNRSELPYANHESQEANHIAQDCLAECLKPLADDLSMITNQLGGATEQLTLRQVLRGIDDCSRSTKRTVEELVRKFESLNHGREGSPAQPLRIGPNEAQHWSGTREALEATRTDLSKKMDDLIKRFEGMCIPMGPETVRKAPVPSFVMTKTDLGALKEEIAGALIAQINSLRAEAWPPATFPANIHDELSRIGASIRNDEAQRVLQVQQQADSVRYLNELNSWLENFVKNGTAQINGLAGGVEKLCRDLGSGSESPGGSILNEIHAMLSELRNRGDTMFLQQSIERLTETININSQNTMNMQTLVGFMERQRQDQETFLRAFTAEISGEIKGERLRFVEAMKEATAINVQMQVDSLKKELAHQVVVVSQDLGRLESEKRAVETKIANLHAFHANQKQNLGHQSAPLTVTANRPTYRPLTRQPQYPAYAAYQQSRPLPYPR